MDLGQGGEMVSKIFAGNVKQDMVTLARTMHTLWNMRALSGSFCSFRYFGFKEQKCTQVKQCN